MKTKLTPFQTEKGSFITTALISVIDIILIILIVSAFNLEPIISLAGGIILIGITFYLADKITNVSTEQQKWLLENTPKEIIHEEIYQLDDFYPEQKYDVMSDGEFKKQPRKHLQDDLEFNATTIIFKTDSEKFFAKNTSRDIIDDDIKFAINSVTRDTTLTYYLPVSAETFQEWSQKDEPFYIKSFLKYAENKD